MACGRAKGAAQWSSEVIICAQQRVVGQIGAPFMILASKLVPRYQQYLSFGSKLHVENLLFEVPLGGAGRGKTDVEL